MEHINSCLDGPNFFNLSGQVVDDATEKLLRKGGKYVPFVKVDYRKRKEQFTTEFCEIINNIIKFIAPPSKQVNPVTLKRDTKRLVSYFNNHEMVNNAKLVRSIFKWFWTKRTEFLDSLPTSVKHNIQDIKDGFKTKDGAIFIESDKGVGFTYIKVKDLIDQYRQINLQQHFEHAQVDEEQYLIDINHFIKSAKQNLPKELSGIIKPKDFISESKKEGLGWGFKVDAKDFKT